MNFIGDFLNGMIIGIGAVAPGVSGGTFAVMLGVYDKLTAAIANVFHNFKRKVVVLFPLGLGIVAGVLSFSRIMQYLFEYHEASVKFLFIGLMVGTIPSVIKDANKKGFRNIYLIPCITAFLITVAFTILEDKVINVISENNPSLVALVIYGVIIGFGTIVPGVSSSFILMYIGAYENLLDGLVNLDPMVIMPVGMGFGLSILLFAKLIDFLFKKAYGLTYYTVLGFVLGSIISIFPEIEFGIQLIFGIIYCLIGFFLSFLLGQREK